jgi:uncharacterized coiled-coil protein SlyX
MLEASISAGVALVAAAAAYVNKVNTRFIEQERRLDGVELRIAEKYVTREELSSSLAKFEDHMVRIELKLDSLVHSFIAQKKS